MANLSNLIGGGGVKSVTQYDFDGTTLTDNGDFSQTVTISTVSSLSKTSINLLTDFSKASGGLSSSQGLLGIKLASTSTVAYFLDSGALTSPWRLSFEVIEYN